MTGSNAPRLFALILTCSAVLGAVLPCACAPTHAAKTPLGDLANLGSLNAVMEEQEHTAEPHFAKASADTLTEDDLVTLADVGDRLVATSARTKAFSKDPEFDALADQLGGHAKALADAARAKDVAAAKKALGDVHATCDACHSKFH
ncbi:MAG: cytochrome c [Deltaproteobacteria bacterium]|nr:cytochrome c [Deltaproteobacteria bacterium]